MYDSKLEERKKNFQKLNLDPCKRREEFGLSLRKEKLFNNLMEKRLNNKSKNISLEIDPSRLNIPEIMRENFEKSDPTQRFEYIIKWLSEDDTNHYQNNNFTIMSDIKKFAIFNLREISEDLELDPDQDLNISNNLIQILLYELFESQEIAVKFEISQIILNLSCDSTIFTETLLDVDYFAKFLVLTYSNSLPLMDNILKIMGNVICENEIDDVNELSFNVPIVSRIKEILIHSEIENTNEIKNTTLWLLARFGDFIPIFAAYFDTNNLILDLDMLKIILEILTKLSQDDKNIAEIIFKCNLVFHIIEIMNRKSLEPILIVECLRIIGNLMVVSDEMVDYLINHKILDSYEKLLNSYMNSYRKEDNIILIEVIWSTTNIAAGTDLQIQKLIFDTNIPKIVLQINKYKHDNRILLESIILFYNALCKGNNFTILEIFKLDFLRLICDAINNSDDIILLIRSFNVLIKVMELSKKIFYTLRNIRNELSFNNTIIKIEKCVNHKNKEISEKANKILNMFDEDKKGGNIIDDGDIMECEMD